jgi:transposase
MSSGCEEVNRSMRRPMVVHRLWMCVPQLGEGVRAAIEAAGASLLYLLPCSPDFNPIENAFTKLKAMLRKAAERTVESLRHTIGHLDDQFTPLECANFFAAAGYEPN